MSSFPKTDLASARRVILEKAWYAYLKSLGPINLPGAQTKSKSNLTLNRFMLRTAK